LKIGAGFGKTILCLNIHENKLNFKLIVSRFGSAMKKSAKPSRSGGVDRVLIKKLAELKKTFRLCTT
jgi:hypothetical protein